MNRYFSTTVDNTPPEDTNGNDIERFPIDSIVKPLRPVKGISKARIGAAVIADDYLDDINPRFYVSSEDDKYKYWISPNMSNDSGAITGCQPRVIYSENVTVNKIVIKLENTWSTPADWVVETTTVASPAAADWTVVATNPIIRNDGQVILYWNGTSWSSTQPSTLTATRSIRGVRLTVNTLTGGRLKNGDTTYYKEWSNTAQAQVSVITNGANAYFSLIEISARLEADFSDRLSAQSDTFDAGEASMLSPMGEITSNVGSVTLWNGDNYLNKENALSPYAKLMEPNARMNLQYVFTIGGVSYPVQEFSLFVERWNGQSSHEVTVELTDHSKFLKESNPPPMMYENVTLTEIMYRLCDSIGFTNYQITTIDAANDFVIPVWWADGEKNVWEVLSDLAVATQSLVLFDAWGVLQVRPREAGLNPNRPVDWTLRAVTSGTEVTDIVTFDQNTQYEANVVTIAFQKSRWSKWNNGQPSLQTVWEPEGVVALRSAPITRAISESGLDTIQLTPKEIKIWPYDGLVNIEGEILRYKGKEYVYFTGPQGKTRNVAWLEEEDDIRKYRALTPQGYRHKNHSTGRLKITERGVWNTWTRSHEVAPRTYDIRRLVGGNRVSSKRGFDHNRKESSVTLSSAGTLKKSTDRLLMTTGDSNQQGDYKMYGFRVWFDEGKAFKDQIAGLVFHNSGTQENGYYVEISPNESFSDKDKKGRKAVSVYSRTTKARQGENSNTTKTYDVKPDAKTGCKPVSLGSDADVKKDGQGDTKKKKKEQKKPVQYYDVDVWIEKLEETGRHRIKVWVNGMEMANEVMKNEDKQEFNTKFGLYIRGKTKATFDFLYAVRQHERLFEPPDDMSFLDRVRGGYYGTFADRELPYNNRTRYRLDKKKSTKKKNNKPIFYFDEFGAEVHEVREMSVKFTQAPVLHSRLYMTNDWSAVCTEYRSTPFDANFVIVNAARQNAIVNGAESLNAFGSSQEIDHKLNVIGRPLIVDEEETITRKNEDQIRARGEIETQFSSTWIQSKAAANVLGDWILNHWSTGVDEATATVFGNPLFEVGDVVAVEYPGKNLTATNAKYFVTGINNSFDFGISTTLTLRRVVAPVV